MSSTLIHQLPPLRTENIVSRNEPEINPICLLWGGGGDLAIPHSRLTHHLVPGKCEHPTHKNGDKVSHTVSNLLRIGNAAGFSVSTAVLLHKLFTFCAYFSRISVTQPTPVASP